MNNQKVNIAKEKRYTDIFCSFGEVSETDEILHQLAELNFNEKKIKNNNKNDKNLNELKIKKKPIKKIIEQKNDKPLSKKLLNGKINRIIISMQGLNFKDSELKILNDFNLYLNKIDEKNFKYIDLLLDGYFELISRIQEEINVKEKFSKKLTEISLNIENYEKNNIIFQQKIKEKEKEVLNLLNQLNEEKEKNKDDSKSIVLENMSLKKENQELTDTILLYKNKLRKSEADYMVIQEKMKKLSSENESKEKSISSFEKQSDEKNENGSNSNNKINDKYFSIKKLNMSLIYLLKEINKMIVKYDSSLADLIDKTNNSNDKVVDLNCNIESTVLVDDANMKIFRKNFLYNMDRIIKKIDLIQKNMGNESKDKKEKSFNNGSTDYKEGKNLSEKWYDKYHNDKVGYVFDKEKVIKCEEDDNGGK